MQARGRELSEAYGWCNKCTHIHHHYQVTYDYAGLLAAAKMRLTSGATSTGTVVVMATR